MRLALALLALPLALAPAATAHVETKAGPYRVTIGWGNEPPITGAENFVDVQVADGSGAPVSNIGSDLRVQVSFGGERTTLSLVPGEAPGTFRAVIVPTRAGAYGFHVTGRLKDRGVDVRETCSDRTFDCVVPSSQIQFPAGDPTLGEVAQKLRRVQSRAERATDRADGARKVAIAAIVVAVLAAAAGAGLGFRARRTSG